MPAQPSVWSTMCYTPPRGPCNFKPSLLAPGCPCLRFMLHPVKAATSFECDGCSHHASYHVLENAAEDAVMRKWQAVEAEGRKEGGAQAVAGAGRKRRRIADRPAHEEREVLEIPDDDAATADAASAFESIGAFPTTQEANAPMDRVSARSTRRPGAHKNRLYG